MMNKLITLMLVLLGSITSFAQSYDKPPKLVFLYSDDNKPIVVFASNQSYGKLTYEDTVGFKIYDSIEYIYIYKKRESINLENSYETMHIPLNLMDNLMLGGMEYIRINSTYYRYTTFQMGLQAEQAKHQFK